ncbi:hypothetical protein DFH09DRAFT_1170333, partial [Mycena vulgaris]
MCPLHSYPPLAVVFWPRSLATRLSSSPPTSRFPSTPASHRGLASASPPHPAPLLCVAPSLPPVTLLRSRARARILPCGAFSLSLPFLR